MLSSFVLICNICPEKYNSKNARIIVIIPNKGFSGNSKISAPPRFANTIENKPEIIK